MISSEQAYSILDIKDNIFLSKDGNISMVFVVTNPEPYTLDDHKLDLRHAEQLKAFKNIPQNVFVHQKDIVLKKKYDSNKHYWRESFLTRSDNKYFNGRDTIEHYCILAFTLSELNSLEKSYIGNPFSYSEKLTKQDGERINSFVEAVKNSVSIISKIYNTKIVPFKEEELKDLFFNYVNGFHEDGSLRDLIFDTKMEIGENYYSVFSLSDSSYFPDRITNVLDDKSINAKNVTLKTGFMDSFGVFFPKNHIYNQVLHFPGNEKLKKELAYRVELFGKHKSFSPKINFEYKRLEGILNDVIQDDSILCYSHYSLLTWANTKEELKKNEDAVKDILSNKEIKFYIPSHEALEDLFLGTIIGRESKLHRDYFFINKLEVAICLKLNYSFYEDDEEGIVFQDRLLQVPHRKDWWDRKKKRIAARNFILFAPTGSGKSSAIQNVVYQFLEEGVRVIVAEFGSSFQQLTKLYPDRSAHISYDRKTPLGINSFDLNNKELTGDKIRSLTAIVMKFWRLPIEDKQNVNIEIAVSKTIEEYYLHDTGTKSFPNYYEFIKNSWEMVFNNQNIPPQYFDVESFLHVCSQFLKGGLYENVCSTKGDTENILLNKEFVVFELRQIKDDPFLVSVVLSILNDTVKEKILSDRTTRGYLIFDEMAESQEMKNVDTGEDILSTVAFLTQGIRKENGAVGLIYQTPTQMPEDNHYAASIIGNTQILGVLQGNEQVYDNIIKRFHIKNNEHIALMKSVQNDFTNDRPYSEMFLRFNENYATVVKLEFPKEKYYAFQTEGEVWAELQNSYAITNNLEQSINQIIKKNHG
jgi:conjugal transfer ATP-binding protein TraC